MYIIISWHNISFEPDVFIFEGESESEIYDKIQTSKIVCKMFAIPHTVLYTAIDQGFEFDGNIDELDYQWADRKVIDDALKFLSSQQIMKILRCVDISNIIPSSPLIIVKESLKLVVCKKEKSDEYTDENIETNTATGKIYVDGGMNKKTGDEAWACVVNESGADLISANKSLVKDLTIKSVKLPVGWRDVAVAKFKDVASQQNNGAELLAMLIGLRIATQPNSMVNEICSDSQLIVQYWSKGHVNHETRAKMDPIKIKVIDECKKLREKFENTGGKVSKISGGKNLADLGYH